MLFRSGSPRKYERNPDVHIPASVVRQVQMHPIREPPKAGRAKSSAAAPRKEGTNQEVRNYIIKRILQAILILFCVMFIIYALIRCLPSSFAQTMAIQLSQAPGAKPYEEWLQQLNASYGLDLDIVPGFFTWLSKAIVGNFGDSWKWNVPAVTKFNEGSEERR